MIHATALLFLLAGAQEKPRPSLEETIRTLHKNMKSEAAEEQVKALKAILPTRKDLEVLFPKHVDVLWNQLEPLFKKMEETIGQIAGDFNKRGEISEIKLTDLRAGENDRYKAVFEMIPKDIPAFNYVVVHEKGRTGGGTYLYVNDRWILLRNLDGVPAVLKQQK